MRKTGNYQKLGNVDYFIPFPLPPKNPELQLDTNMFSLLAEASFAIGRLNEMSLRIPDFKRFIKAYITKEALLSSEIEGIHTTLVDAFTYPLAESNPSKDTRLVINYTKALDTTLRMIREEGLPIASRILLEAHKTLMAGGDNEKSAPGLYRKQAVRVGNLTPPPAQEIPSLIHSLEIYINETSSLPPLIRTGLAHAHFEMIHPFLDGNGRIGRLLIVLMLIQYGLLNEPILYPSYYLKKNQAEYYQRLDAIRTQGDYEGWVAYYLTAVRDSAEDAYRRAKDTETLERRLKEMIHHDPLFSRIKETATSALDLLFAQPITHTSELSKKLGKTYNTANSILERFIRCGIVTEETSKKRNKTYHFKEYLEILNQDYTHT